MVLGNVAPAQDIKVPLSLGLSSLWQPTSFHLLFFPHCLLFSFRLRRKPQVSAAGLRKKRVSCRHRNVPVSFQVAYGMPDSPELLFDLIL